MGIPIYRTRDGRCSAARRRPHTPMRRGREFPPFSPHQCTHARHKYQSHARTYVYNKRRSPGSWCACLEPSASRAASSPPVRGSQEFRRSSAARDAVTQEVAHFATSSRRWGAWLLAVLIATTATGTPSDAAYDCRHPHLPRRVGTRLIAQAPSTAGRCLALRPVEDLPEAESAACPESTCGRSAHRSGTRTHPGRQ